LFQIASIQTEYQQIDIVDVIVPRFNRISKYLSSLAGDQSYESLHPEYYEPDRIVFLDGVIQSRKQGQAAFHESLVHPGMFAHDNPKRVAVIGGGEGATLREVLKHKTVEEAVMIDIDEVMVRTSKEHLPDWSDCSDLLGSADWCGDDPRARIYYEDALGWFMSRYGGEADTEEPFDVIIMDSL
jgi:spermidine synthase